jgi:hypothetical protein
LGKGKSEGEDHILGGHCHKVEEEDGGGGRGGDTRRINVEGRSLWKLGGIEVGGKDEWGED